MEWVLKEFNELSVYELYEILKLRSDIFVVEQNCVYLDLDDKDQEAKHLYLKVNDEIVAYLRILNKGVSYKEASLGRVITKYRGLGYGKLLVDKGIEIADEDLMIGAQEYAVPFYEKCGFKVVSEHYLEDGIYHVKMYRPN